MQLIVELAEQNEQEGMGAYLCVQGLCVNMCGERRGLVAGC